MKGSLGTKQQRSHDVCRPQRQSDGSAESTSPPAYGIDFLDEIGASESSRQAIATGALPDSLSAEIERLSGIDLSDVEVHYDSHEPALLRASAFARDDQIHLAPGQERHLAHEAWHLVQQRQGRVEPEGQIAGTAVNEDPHLEYEAREYAARLGDPARRFHPAPRLTAARVTGDRGDVAQLAGHGTLKQAGEELVVKVTSEKEIAAYERYGPDLEGAIPAYHLSLTGQQQEQVAAAKRALLAERGLGGSEGKLKSGQGFAVIENLLPGGAAGKIIFDIKIGESTASRHELQSEKSPAAARLKKLKMTAGDLATGSRSPLPFKASRGWRAIPQQGEGGRMSVGRRSPAFIRGQLETLGADSAIALEKIGEGLRTLESKMTAAKVTFVASSVLIVIDKLKVENTRVALIDLAHPIAEGEPSYAKFRDRFSDGLRSLAQYFRQIG